MKVTLVSNDPHIIKKARSLYRRRVGNLRLTMRNGNLYTMNYNPGVQPRTEKQEKSWSLFKEANLRVTNDFKDPSKKAHWQNLQKKQSQYKTARGLARAYYMSALKRQMNDIKQDVSSSTAEAKSCLRLYTRTIISSSVIQPSQHSYLMSVPQNNVSWTHFRNVHWWRNKLRQLPSSV